MFTCELKRKFVFFASFSFRKEKQRAACKDFSVLEKVYIGDTVQIFHEDLKIELSAKVVSFELDALFKRYKKVIFSNVKPKHGDTQRQYAKQQKEE